MSLRNVMAWTVFSLLLAASAARAAEGDVNYLPLVADSEYQYQGTFQEKVHNDRLVVKAKELGNAKWYYFAAEENSVLLIGNFPWPGVVRKQDQQIIGFDASFFSWLDEYKQANEQVFLKLPLKQGDKTEISILRGRMKGTVTVLGFEDVTVPAGTFKNCAKIECKFATEKNAGIFWLAPDVGLVKWQRETGRVDELTKYSIPK